MRSTCYMICNKLLSGVSVFDLNDLNLGAVFKYVGLAYECVAHYVQCIV